MYVRRPLPKRCSNIFGKKLRIFLKLPWTPWGRLCCTNFYHFIIFISILTHQSHISQVGEPLLTDSLTDSLPSLLVGPVTLKQRSSSWPINWRHLHCHHPHHLHYNHHHRCDHHHHVVCGKLGSG